MRLWSVVDPPNMNEASTTALPTPIETPALRMGLFTGFTRYFRAWPFGLRRDLLYLWATFRLRYRPIKMLVLMAVLGGACALWQWAGQTWAVPWLAGIINVIQFDAVRDLLMRTSRAIFSSLNILSCLSIFVMARTLRHLLKQGHIESLLLVPTRFKPSALFYAISLRYMPLAFVAILVIYLDSNPARNPFQGPPFLATGTQPFPGDMWPLYWAGFRELSIFIFCPANLFMDLAIAYWFFSRLKVSHQTTIGAIVFIGFVSPVGLMYINEIVTTFVEDRIQAREGMFEVIADTLRPGNNLFYYSIQSISQGVHYLLTSVLSVMVGLLALGDLDVRWYRICNSTRRDPVLLKQLD